MVSPPKSLTPTHTNIGTKLSRIRKRVKLEYVHTYSLQSVSFKLFWDSTMEELCKELQNLKEPKYKSALYKVNFKGIPLYPTRSVNGLTLNSFTRVAFIQQYLDLLKRINE